MSYVTLLTNLDDFYQRKRKEKLNWIIYQIRWEVVGGNFVNYDNQLTTIMGNDSFGTS